MNISSPNFLVTHRPNICQERFGESPLGVLSNVVYMTGDLTHLAAEYLVQTLGACAQRTVAALRRCNYVLVPVRLRGV